VAKRKQTKSNWGRPRKHSPDAVTLTIRLPKAHVQQIDKSFATRQDGVAGIVAEFFTGTPRQVLLEEIERVAAERDQVVDELKQLQLSYRKGAR